MDNAKWCPIFDTREEILQGLLDKKISSKTPIWHPVFSKQSFLSQKKSFGTIIPIANVREIEFLNNHQIALTMDTDKHFMIDLNSNEQWEFSTPCMKLDCTLPVPEKVEKVVNWREDGCANIRITQGFPYHRSANQEFDYEISFFPLYCNEKQPSFIWVKKDTCMPKNNHLTDGECDSSNNIHVYKSVYNASLDPAGIISQCKEKFTTYYDLSQLRFQSILTYPHCRREQLCSLDKHFIVQISHLATFCSYSIIYPDKTGNKILSKEFPADPCSIALHPINRDIFVLMRSEDRTLQYRNSQGDLLAEQKYSHDMVEKSCFYNTYLSFSPNGNHLAAVFPEKEEIVVFNVPLRVQIEQKKLFFILFCLKNQNVLPRDIVGKLFKIFKSY